MQLRKMQLLVAIFYLESALTPYGFPRAGVSLVHLGGHLGEVRSLNHGGVRHIYYIVSPVNNQIDLGPFFITTSARPRRLCC